MQTENIEKDAKMNVYEVSFLLLPSLAIEQVPSVSEAIKSLITKLGGHVFAGEDPVLIDLAYPITKVFPTIRHKETKGCFGWVKFEMESDQVGGVKKSLDENQNVLRFLIIKTVKENTLLNGKMKFHKEERSRKEEKEEVVPEEEVKEISSEELDKSIDDLVIV